MSDAPVHTVADTATAMLTIIDMMGPIIEAAEGQKAALEQRGWSPTAAEAYALELLLGVTRSAFTQPSR